MSSSEGDAWIAKGNALKAAARAKGSETQSHYF